MFKLGEFVRVMRTDAFLKRTDEFGEQLNLSREQSSSNSDSWIESTPQK